MPIVFQCPSCSTRIRISSSKSGAKVDCPRCETRVRVPSQADSIGEPELQTGPPNPPPIVPPPRRATLIAEEAADRVVTLKCTNCGGNLDIAADMESFACGYCGTKQVVQRRGGTVSLKPIGEAIARVQVGTDRTAAELAVRRLQEDLASLDKKWEDYEDRAAEAESQAPKYDGPVGCLRIVGLFVTLTLTLFVALALSATEDAFVTPVVILGIIGLCVVLVKGGMKEASRRRDRYAAARHRYSDHRDKIKTEIKEHLDVLKRRNP